MRRRDFIGLVGGTVALPFAAKAQRAQTVDEALREAVERKEIPGVVAMAADRNGIVYQGAFGLADIAEARLLKLDALFRLASMTKPVTAVAAKQRRVDGLGPLRAGGEREHRRPANQPDEVAPPHGPAPGCHPVPGA